MQTTHLWHKLYLHRGKIIAALILLLLCTPSFSQRRVNMNNPNYDNRFLSYGFLIGVHTSSYQLSYSDAFLAREFDNLYSISPSWSSAFSLGFIVNMKLADFFDLRLLPKVAFYEHALEYLYLDRPAEEVLVETTVVEFPLFLKYKSERRGNNRMYIVGGIKPGTEVSAQNELEGAGEDNLPIRGFNLSAEFGFGLDIYYPLFKFSPELRFSRGFANMLGSEINPLSEGIDRLTTNTVTLYLLFQ